ncbi:exosortase A [Rugamonas sp.]|uniref:exosortase A n=1 Tax=Rugamonas sp. TaxID=1926287 RepID=UPI0025CC76E9|nr:exosortase A [Rugamonas sp.]
MSAIDFLSHGAPAPAPRQPRAAAPGTALIVLLILLLPLAAYWHTAASIVAIWERSDTYAHGYVILPITLWLVWRRRDALRQMPLQPCWPALAALALCGAAWLAGELGGVQVVSQYALAAMLALTPLALLGLRMARVIAFPLLFLLFGVPVGENLIAPLVQITAGFTVEALRWTGVPVLREGNHISLPSGDWSVVEACSGLRYLISSVTLGCLYAYLSYRSWRRRALLVLAAVLVPVLANGLRAYMIIMIGHLSGMALAVGVDHLIYGWVFFGLVMLLLFRIGNIWREDEEAPAAGVTRSAPPPAPASTATVAGAALTIAASLLVWPAYLYRLEQAGAALPPLELERFHARAPMALGFTDWTPDYQAPSGSLRQFYALPAGPVGLTLMYYRDQRDGPKLISSGHHLTMADSPWREGASVDRALGQGADGPPAVRETTLRKGQQSLLVWRWYAIDGQPTASDYVGKMLQSKQKMMTGGSNGVVVMLFSPYDDDPEVARARMTQFLQGNAASLRATLTGGHRP